MIGYTEHTGWLLLFHFVTFNQIMSYFFERVFSCVHISCLSFLKTHFKNTTEGTEHIHNRTKH